MNWNLKRIFWYLRAGEHSDYPAVFLNRIIPRLRQEDTVLDIGSGPGLYGLALAPYVKAVVNLDSQELPLRIMQRLAQTKGYKNLVYKKGLWPDTEIGKPVDIVISAFISSSAMRDRYSLAKMAVTARRLLFLVAPGCNPGPPFGYTEGAVAEIKPKKTSSYKESLELVEGLGFNHEVEEVTFDFGQPVFSRKEGAEFLSRQLKIPFGQAREQLQKIARPYRSGYYLPNPRKAVLITVCIN